MMMEEFSIRRDLSRCVYKVRVQMMSIQEYWDKFNDVMIDDQSGGIIGLSSVDEIIYIWVMGDYGVC